MRDSSNPENRSNYPQLMPPSEAHPMPADTNLLRTPRRARERHYEAVVAAELRRLARQLRPASSPAQVHSLPGRHDPDHRRTASSDRAAA